MEKCDAGGVLITGVYGSGKSSVAAEIGYMLEQRRQPYALLDLDYLSWAGTGSSDRAEEFGLLLQNLADVAGNYRRAGIHLFVLAYFLRDGTELQALRKAAGLPLRVARLWSKHCPRKPSPARTLPAKAHPAKKSCQAKNRQRIRSLRRDTGKHAHG